MFRNSKTTARLTFRLRGAFARFAAFTAVIALINGTALNARASFELVLDDATFLTQAPTGVANSALVGAQLDGNDFIFTTLDPSEDTGIFRGTLGSTTIETVAQRNNTTFPSSTNTFSVVSFPQLSGGAIIFSGAGIGESPGVFLQSAAGAPITTVRDTSDPDPTPFAFTSFQGNTLAFSRNTSTPGLNLLARLDVTNPATTPPTILADASTVIPGETSLTFENFFVDPQSLSKNGDIAFSAEFNSGSDRGVFVSRFSDTAVQFIETIATTDTVAPEETATFSRIHEIAIDPENANNVVFTASFGFGSNETDGLFASIDGQLIKIADENTLVPGTTDTFFSIGINFLFATEPGFAIEDGTIVFSANTTSTFGIYAFDLENGIYPIIEGDDDLLGEDVIDLAFNPLGLDDGRLLFTALTDDGLGGSDIGLFLTSVAIPEPASAMLLIAGATGLLIRHRRTA